MESIRESYYSIRGSVDMKNKKIMTIIIVEILFILVCYQHSMATYQSIPEEVFDSLFVKASKDFDQVEIKSKKLILTEDGVKYFFEVNKLASYFVCTSCTESNDCESIKSLKTTCDINPKYFNSSTFSLDACFEIPVNNTFEIERPKCIRVIENTPLNVEPFGFNKEMIKFFEEKWAINNGLNQLGGEAAGLLFMRNTTESSCDSKAPFKEFRQLSDQLIATMNPNMLSQVFKYLGYPLDQNLEKQLKIYLSRQNHESLFGVCEEDNSKTSFGLVLVPGSEPKKVETWTQWGSRMVRNSAMNTLRVLNDAIATVATGQSTDFTYNLLARSATNAAIVAQYGMIRAQNIAGATGEVLDAAKGVYDATKHTIGEVRSAAKEAKAVKKNVDKLRGVPSPEASPEYQTVEEKILAVARSLNEKEKQIQQVGEKTKEIRERFVDPLKETTDNLVRIKDGEAFETLRETTEFRGLQEYFTNSQNITERPSDFFILLDDLLATPEYDKLIKDPEVQNFVETLKTTFGSHIPELRTVDLQSFKQTPQFMFLMAQAFESGQGTFDSLITRYRAINATIARASADTKSLTESFKNLKRGVPSSSYKFDSMSVAEMSILKDPENPEFKSTFDAVFERWREGLGHDFTPDDSFDNAFKGFFYETASHMPMNKESKIRRMFQFKLIMVNNPGITPDTYDEILQIKKNYTEIEYKTQASWLTEIRRLGGAAYTTLKGEKFQTRIKKLKAELDLATLFSENLDTKMFARIGELQTALNEPSPRWNNNFDEFQRNLVGLVEKYTDPYFLGRATVLNQNLTALPGLDPVQRRILTSKVKNPLFDETLKTALTQKAVLDNKDLFPRYPSRNLADFTHQEVRAVLTQNSKDLSILEPMKPETINNFLHKHLQKLGNLATSDFILNILRKQAIIVGHVDRNLSDLIKTSLTYYKSSMQWNLFATKLSETVRLKGDTSFTPKDVWKLFTRGGLTPDIVAFALENRTKKWVSEETKTLLSMFGINPKSDTGLFFTDKLTQISGDTVNQNISRLGSNMAIPVFYRSEKRFQGKKITGREIDEIEIKDPMNFLSSPTKMDALAHVIAAGRIQNQDQIQTRSEVKSRVDRLHTELNMKKKTLSTFTKQSFTKIETVKDMSTNFDASTLPGKKTRIKTLLLIDSNSEDSRTLEQKIFEWNELATMAFSQNEMEMGFIFFAQAIWLAIQQLKITNPSSSCENYSNLYESLEEIAKKENQLFQLE